MAQQINLLDASLQRRRVALDSGHGLLAIGLAFALSAGAVWGLQRLTFESMAHASAIEQDLAALRTRAAGVAGAGPASRPAAELARWRQAEAGQRRLRAALDSGQAGSAVGPSPYLFALSRQAQPQLWLTGFSLAHDGRSIDIGGRMTDPAHLPGYLRRLNAEPLFRGREFAQLSLKTVEPAVGAEAAGGYTEFALRATPAPLETR